MHEVSRRGDPPVLVDGRVHLDMPRQTQKPFHKMSKKSRYIVQHWVVSYMQFVTSRKSYGDVGASSFISGNQPFGLSLPLTTSPYPSFSTFLTLWRMTSIFPL